jgi:predicted phosphodiesterase
MGSRRVQYVSDIHLEHRPAGWEPPIERRAPVLVLAGDVGSPWPSPRHASYADFLARMSRLFDHVVLIAGNHEYFGHYMEATEALIRDTVAMPNLDNVHYLQNTTWDLPDSDVTFFGGTFWTHVPEEKEVLLGGVWDTAKIPGYTYRRGRGLHATAVAALDVAIAAAKAAGRRLVVVSHHIPRMDLIDSRYTGNPTNVAFASDVPAACAEDLHAEDACTKAAVVAAWIYGHTHTPSCRGIFHCNPIGYPGEREGVEWNLCVEV